jgi:hypothetical protein
LNAQYVTVQGVLSSERKTALILTGIAASEGIWMYVNMAAERPSSGDTRDSVIPAAQGWSVVDASAAQFDVLQPIQGEQASLNPFWRG